MTQEEKAKAYDEALLRARALNNGEDVDIEVGTTACEYIFPELKESEDELTWLTRYIEEEVYSLSMDIRDNEDHIKLKNLKKSLDWLEKQGEKPQGKSAREAINEEKVDNQNCVKPIDKVEPKFMVGDWIACEELNTVKILSVNVDRYEVEFIDGNKGFPHIDYIDRNFHLWTIQDAKNGDVLADKYNNIGIFQKCVGICWYSYIYLGCDGEIRGFNIGGSHGQTDTHPATKGQRKLLFKKMKEAGYKWDSNIKEFNKIEIK